MACTRCGGFSVLERFLDAEEVGARMYFVGERCLNCGAIDDPVIRANRRSLSALRTAATRRTLPERAGAATPSLPDLPAPVSSRAGSAERGPSEEGRVPHKAA